MTDVHLHLILNHLPVVGFIFAIGFLAYAFLQTSADVKRVALGFVFVTALSTIPAYYSGEGAEDVVENLSGFNEDLIEAHEERAELALALTQITGFIALVSLLFGRASTPQRLKTLSLVTIVAAIASAVALGLTANTGGKIRHSEIRNGQEEPHDRIISEGRHRAD
ncbi:MAG: hypothetical protein ACOH5I_17525 [Oligoflexus sp.]